MSTRRALLPDPKNIPDRFALATIADVFWVIGSVLALCLLLFSIITFTAVLQHLFCVKPSKNKKYHIDPKIIKRCSILCCLFGLICSMAGFSTFPICTSFQCGYNSLGNAYFIINLNSYILSKLFLYILFIHRLFNKYSSEIYQYPKYIKTLLNITIIIIAIAITLTTIFAIIIDHHYNNDKVDGFDLSVIIAVAIYVIADFLLSGFTLILFFAPLWNMAKVKKQNKQKFVKIIWKYGGISLMQTIISMFYGISLIIRFRMGWYHTAQKIGVSYLDMCMVIQLFDILVTMLCIYIGFVKKETQKSYCRICGDSFYKCCCKECCEQNPNKNKNKGNGNGYKTLWDKDLENKPINNSDSNVIYVKDYDDNYGGSATTLGANSGSTGNTGSTDGIVRKHKTTDTGCTDILQNTLQSSLMDTDTTMEY